MNNTSASTTSAIPHIKVSGDARSRGLAQGQKLREKIQRTFSFYNDVFFKKRSLSDHDVQSKADQIKNLIQGFNPEYCIEIEAIAEGADMPAWKIYALNARTEILNTTAIAECTSLFFQETRLLGQTWDWL